MAYSEYAMQTASQTAGQGPGAMGLAQLCGHCWVIGMERVVRRMLTLAVLTLAMMGPVGLPACDSGCVASAEDRPARDADPPQPVRAQESRGMRQPVDYIYPPPLDDTQRGRLVGDFWTDGQMRRIFDPPAAAGW
jgi:hypothetical protein